MLSHWSLSIPPEKPQETSGLQMFSGGIEKDQRYEMD